MVKPGRGRALSGEADKPRWGQPGVGGVRANPARRPARAQPDRRLTFAWRYTYVRSTASRCRRVGEYAINDDGVTEARMPSRASTSSARSAMSIWPNAVGWTWSVITRLRAPQRPQVDHERSHLVGDPRDQPRSGPPTLAPARGRPRSSGAVIVSTRSQRSDKKRSATRNAASKAAGIPVHRAHVVDPDVQAADVIPRAHGATAATNAGICPRTTSDTHAPSTA